MFEEQMRPQILSVQKKNQILEKKQTHLNNVEQIRDHFVNTIENSLELNCHTEVYTFSMQRSLEMPSLKSVNDVYFRRPLWFFNFCLYDEVRKMPYMYTWDESIAGRGSQEIVSCIMRHVKEVAPKDTSQIICTVQALLVKIEI